MLEDKFCKADAQNCDYSCNIVFFEKTEKQFVEKELSLLQKNWVNF